ncbi:FAD:protein FMN transferase [Neobacillus dielmonensis]|uniref:FAD:protein FMN transferase n=1 Tax=Neobacillus dielmonensis TaxID=1347369 RepID=UPI000AE75F85|nr:FAD:protein FMN transferase [Neobacillus dielmonensis]
MTVKHEDPNDFETLTIKAMNSQFYIAVTTCGFENWQEVIVHWIKHVEKEWSRFHLDTELQKINRLLTGQKLCISPPLFDCLQKAEEYRTITEGRFSPYLLSQMEYHGYDHSFPFENCPAKAGLFPQSFQKKTAPFHFEGQFLAVERCDSGNIDLGGIGKGYTVQAAAQWLKSSGAKAGIVDGGGDIAVWSDGEKVWHIGIAHPYDEERDIAQLYIKNGGIATSNIIYRSWRQGETIKHHLLNGQTGLPVETDIIQATVITGNCLDAEIMAKLCFMEQDQALSQVLRTINPVYSSVLVSKSGKITLI